jgi:hypothetical protein
LPKIEDGTLVDLPECELDNVPAEIEGDILQALNDPPAAFGVDLH